MNFLTFWSKSPGSRFGFNWLHKNLAGATYFQVWIGKRHFVIGNGK